MLYNLVVWNHCIVAHRSIYKTFKWQGSGSVFLFSVFMNNEKIWSDINVDYGIYKHHRRESMVFACVRQFEIDLFSTVGRGAGKKFARSLRNRISNNRIQGTRQPSKKNRQRRADENSYSMTVHRLMIVLFVKKISFSTCVEYFTCVFISGFPSKLFISCLET